MARQNTTPMQYQRSTRVDDTVLMSSGEAGEVVLVGQIPLLRGDSASGNIGIDVDLAELGLPLINAVQANFQAWFVPKSAHPQFSGYDEFMHAYQDGAQIKALGQTDRNPPPLFSKIVNTPAERTTLQDGDIHKTLGIHIGSDDFNTDVVDAYNLVLNFRLAAHSKELTRREYAAENLANSVKFAPAFWPSGQFSGVVPDYERALVVGALDLDVSAGTVPLTSILATAQGGTHFLMGGSSTNNPGTAGDQIQWDTTEVFGDLAGQTLTTTLAHLDMARKSQAYAKVRASMTGADTTGFMSDEVLLAEMMQGLTVPSDLLRRPWLLDADRVTFGMEERHATDAANLEKSISQGRASALLRVNVPKQDVGGHIIVTMEVLPERIFEASEDVHMTVTSAADYPDALRDSQRIEQVDTVTNSRVDMRHANPNQTFGFERMNEKWNRNYTRLGGAYFQPDASNPWTEQRSAIWLANVENPAFDTDYYIAPAPFPKYVFAFEDNPAFEFVCRHNVGISGLTQFGEEIFENTDDYDAVSNAS